jgi:hypothetical protein
MLFAATVALSRVILLMTLDQPNRQDHITLQYLGKALILLTQRATSWQTLVTEAVIFTVARLVTISVKSPLLLPNAPLMSRSI